MEFLDHATNRVVIFEIGPQPNGYRLDDNAVFMDPYIPIIRREEPNEEIVGYANSLKEEDGKVSVELVITEPDKLYPHNLQDHECVTFLGPMKQERLGSWKLITKARIRGVYLHPPVQTKD